MQAKIALWREWAEPEPSPLAVRVQQRMAAGLLVQDFITTNPFDCGFQFNNELLKEILGRAGLEAQRYAADPLGRIKAREAVAECYGQNISPAQVVLTPGTSMAYFYLFRLLAREGGEILCPAPTYPLFDDLAKIAGLRVRRYHLDRIVTPEGITRWVIDPAELKFQMTPQTCAIVLVSPHNPTGTIINEQEMQEITEIAAQAEVPLILDEVFRTYTRKAGTLVPHPALANGLVFTLNGLSKSHYLPGLKAAWIVVEGEPVARTAMLNALEYMADTFLPVQEITQAALPSLLGADGLAEADRLGALQRIALEKRLSGSKTVQIAVPEAGPYICIPLCAGLIEKNTELIENLTVQKSLDMSGALLHPGHLYLFPEPCLVATVFNPALLSIETLSFRNTPSADFS